MKKKILLNIKIFWGTTKCNPQHIKEEEPSEGQEDFLRNLRKVTGKKHHEK
jgi:hypothetical protein